MKTTDDVFKTAVIDESGRECRAAAPGGVIDCAGFTQHELPDGRVELIDAFGHSCGLFVGKQTLEATLQFLGR